jgi:hypothetical protein
MIVRGSQVAWRISAVIKNGKWGLTCRRRFDDGDPPAVVSEPDDFLLPEQKGVNVVAAMVQ